MFSDVSTEDLKLLAAEVECGDLSVPLTAPALLSRGLQRLAQHAAELSAFDRETLLLLCKAITLGACSPNPHRRARLDRP